MIINFKKIFFVSFLLTLSYPQANDLDTQPEVRRITPPLLDSAHLGKRILCHRPMRHGSPHMNVELLGDKLVAHNYGHGGSGWTLGPGSADYVNNLLIRSLCPSDFTSPITIVGAGALGLFTAYDLEQKGYKNLTLMAASFDDLTSHNAGGLLAPVSMDNDPKLQKIIDAVGIEAYKFYKAIAEGNHPHFAKGAVIVPTYFETREESGLEPYVGQVMEPAKDVVIDFGNGTKRPMVSYDDGIFIDTAAMMHSLTTYLKTKNVRFIKRKITHFSEIQDPTIINCSGLGASDLNQDSTMVSVQGHLIMLKDQKPETLHHMILVYFKESVTASGQKIKRSFYMFPKRLPESNENDVGVLGGTFIEGATADTPNEEEFDIMLKQAKEFYGTQ